ncbi:hypothetical protein A374_19220 [Fictibacillus macauensis ZFHKF-1]|uniref:Transmembrane protein n=1 Tax=Fictibacillus macauensis ZFHKF-1 TaxID=1196324 RepID=I8ADP7_9BACL|nr:DUF6442 family protein [Fictibacillus macauensis]EIT83682.1 hypothetical protein A374_19220 [Fictibacillus macauensis ZFHKF-1]
MKKEEILEKGDSDKKAAETKRWDDEAFIYGAITMVIIGALLIAWKSFHDQPHWELSGLVCSGLAAGSIYKYKVSKQINYLVSSVLTVLVTLVSFYIFYSTQGV